MKKLFAAYSVILTIAMLLIGCKEKIDSKYDFRMHDKLIAMPNDWRKTTGYDSIQLIYRGDSIYANFCYPTKWVDTVIWTTSSDTIFLDKPLDSIYIIKNHGEQP